MIQTFDFNDSAVRVMLRQDETWFMAKDVCDVLGLAHAPSAIRDLEDDEKATVRNEHSRPGEPGAKMFNIISESGLYALIFKSRKPEAKMFRRWVTNEVLPAIRTTGRYELAPTRTLQDVRELLLTSARDVRDNKLDVGRAQQIANLAARYLEAVKLEGDAIGYDKVLGLRSDEGQGRLLRDKDVVQGVSHSAMPSISAAESGLPSKAAAVQNAVECEASHAGADASDESTGAVVP